METEMSYEKTIELERNIAIKNEAEKIYQDFLNNVMISPKNYVKGKGFILRKDEHNQTYLAIKDDIFYFVCEFLHEYYSVMLTPGGIFEALKREKEDRYRGVIHLRAETKTK